MSRTAMGLAALLGLFSAAFVGLQSGEESKSTKPSWPAELADRHLQIETENFVLFAWDPAGVKDLASWIDAELTAFRQKHESAVLGTGLVLTIDSPNDVDPAVATWVKQFRGRDRLLTWTIPKRQFTQTTKGRPYTLRGDPYFRESFDVPPQDAVKLGLITADMPAISWVCFVTSDRHFSRSFDAETERIRKESAKALAKVPAQVRAMNEASLAIMLVGRELVFVKVKYLDRELMHFQRREALRRAWLTAAFDGAVPEADMDMLTEEIDADWKALWRRRPID